MIISQATEVGTILDSVGGTGVSVLQTEETGHLSRA